MNCPIMTPLIGEWAKEFGLSEQEALIDYGLAQDRVGNIEVTKELFKAEVERQKQLKQSLQQTTQQPYTIEYTPKGKQTLQYTIVGTKIYNKEGREVFAGESVDRNKIFANLAVSQGRAVIVEHKGHKYVVNNKDAIISVISGDIMKWGEENGDRKAILEEAKKKFDILQRQSSQPKIDLSNYEFYSGAAKGSDTEWSKQAKALGIKIKDYTVSDWDNLSQEWKDTLETEYQSVVNTLGRKALDANDYAGKLVRRDMMQADKADAIFAIGTVASNGLVDGGTGYATTRGIQRGIPVYLFDQEDNTWKVWKDNKFVPTEEPTLTPHAATIGTRKIQENGKLAIKSILSKVSKTSEQKIVGENISSKGSPITKEIYGVEVSTESSKLDAKGEIPFISQTPTTSPTAPQGAMDKVTQKHQGNWSRQEAQNNPRVLYVFTDNTDRDSGSGIIPKDSWYSKKYGEGHHFPTMTAAVVRGLENSRPISTQRWYHQGAKDITGRWTDASVEEFTKVIEDELQEIVREFNTGKYDTIMFPDGDGLFNTNISNITKERTPKLYDTLSSLLDKYGFNSLIPKDNIIVPQGTEGIKLGGFSKTQAQAEAQTTQPTLQIQVKEPLLVSRQYLRYNDKFDSPLVKFHRTFNSFERANAVEAITYDFIKLIDRLNPEAKDKERQSWIIANISLLKSELKKSLEDYLNNSRMQENEKKRFGEDFVTNKLNYIIRILADNNLDFLLKDAAITIEKTEGVIIDFDTKEAKSTEEVEAEKKATEDNEDTGKDGYMIIARETDPKTTLGTRVRKVLANTPKGNERNVFGKPKMLNPDYVHAVLMDKLSNMAYVEDFIQTGNGNIALVALDRLSGKYPWVKTLINKLQNDPMLMSQFFTDFRKDFILYTTTVDVNEELLDDEGNPILDGNGNPVMKVKRVTKYLNQAVALDSTITELINNFENNEKLDKNSIYSDGKVVEENRKLNAEKLATLSSKIKNRYEFNWNDDANRTEAFDTIKELLNAIGFNTTLNDLDGIYGEASFNEDINTILTNLGTILENTIPEEAHLIDYFNGAYTNIAEIVGKVSEIMNVSSARAGDKTFQSYSSTNYINTVLKRLTDKNEERRNKYIQEQFKKFPWFYDKANGKWRNHWVELLESDPNVRAHLQIDNMATITITDEDGNPKVVKYSDWTEDMIKKDFFLQYHGFPNQSKRETQFGRFHMPIYSDSPVVNFITMPKFTGDFRSQILDKLCDVVEQELLRIKDVSERARLAARNTLLGIEKIANYDEVGNKFLFFPKLNNIEGFYNTVNDLLLNNKVDEARTIIKNALRDIMEEGAEEYRNSDPITAQEAINNGIINSESELDEALDEYYWNQAYATTQIIQIATTDLAYYKNGVDFQKRFKEVYASGNKLNTNSTWGKKKERVLYLKDEVLKSNVFSDIEEVLKQAVDEKRITKIDAQAIKNKFKKVNVADAQAYRSIYSMRRVLDMMGQWTPQMQEAVEKFNSGSWTTQDFTTIWQTIKPFMFTQIEDNTPGFFEARKVSHQHKNSEFLLLAMHSLIANSNIGKSEVLKSLNEWMVENDVDVVMFESAVKVGGQGVIQVSSNMTGTQVTDRLNEYRDASKVTIKEFDYEDYVVQQPTPEHLIDHLGIFGSQFRNLIVSDLTDGTTFKVNGKEYTKALILKLYQGAIVENLLEDYERVKGRFATIQDLHDALLDSIKGNPKYGSDIVEALEIVGAVNGKGGRFNIPLYNPSTTEKLQEVINSFFKNAITKQKIKGGNAILVSDFGFVDDLHCVYGTTKEGKKYLKEVECYLPAYAKDFYQAFMKKDAKGNEYLDVSLMPDELKYAIGYRI